MAAPLGLDFRIGLPAEMEHGPRALARMSAVAAATDRDATLGSATRFSLGFMKSMNSRSRKTGLPARAIKTEDTFGHAGADGSFGIAPPAHRFS